MGHSHVGQTRMAEAVRTSFLTTSLRGGDEGGTLAGGGLRLELTDNGGTPGELPRLCIDAVLLLQDRLLLITDVLSQLLRFSPDMWLGPELDVHKHVAHVDTRTEAVAKVQAAEAAPQRTQRHGLVRDLLLVVPHAKPMRGGGTR